MTFSLSRLSHSELLSESLLPLTRVSLTQLIKKPPQGEDSGVSFFWTKLHVK